MENNEIKIDLDQIKKDEHKLQQLAAKIGAMSIVWKPEESKGAMAEALHEQVKEINLVIGKLEYAIRKTKKQVTEGRKNFEQTDKEQAKKY